jgi:hypothetical protein
MAKWGIIAYADFSQNGFEHGDAVERLLGDRRLPMLPLVEERPPEFSRGPPCPPAMKTKPR